MANEKYKCIQCGSEVTLGDVRSGILSFGAFFIECSEKQRNIVGAPKPKGGLQKNNRVVSYACTDCGFISNYLDSVVNGKSN